MPLRAEIRFCYGAAHRKLRAALIEQLGPNCQKCKKPHPRINLAHLTHDSANMKLVDIALVPRAHAKYDARQRHSMTRRTIARRSGQLWISEAVEWAPYASWEIPEPVRDRAIQVPLPLA